MQDLKKEIEGYGKVLRGFRKKKELWGDEEAVLRIEGARLALLREQIHGWCVGRGDEAGVQAWIKDIYAVDLPVCEAKKRTFLEAMAAWKRKRDEEKTFAAYEFLKKWEEVEYGFQCLVAFRSLEYFALLWERDLDDENKVFKWSVDPNNDGGRTGVSRPFFFYFTQMVLQKNIKFISKQYPTGYGKCALPSTRVRTPYGIRTLGEIEVGDSVYSMQDNEVCVRKVTNKWNTRKKQVRITTRGGIEITTSPEHRLYTQRGYVRAKDLAVSDYFYRLCTPLNIRGEWENSDELIFATLMLFDGYCFHNRLTFTKEDNEIFQVFQRVCNSLGFATRISTRENNKAKTIHILNNNGKPDAILAKYGILNCLSKNKTLSDRFLNMPLSQRYSFIGLMLATDGYIPQARKNKRGSLVGVTLASKPLIKGIQELLNSCGIYSLYAEKQIQSKSKTFNAYTLQIPDEYVPKIYEHCYCYQKEAFISERIENIDGSYCNNTNYPKAVVENCKEFKRLVNKQFARNKTFKREIVERFARETGLLSDIVYKDFVWEQIKTIEFIDEETDMVDIEVEGTHNFIANDIVSHNSISDAMAIAWVFGLNPDNDVLKVLGNPALVTTTMNTVVGIMTKPFFGHVFPRFEKWFDGEERPLNMFSICRIREGELALADSSKAMNLKVIAKDTPIDGIRVRFLFLDDICRSKDAGNNVMHEKDIANYWNSWWKRNYNTNDFYVVAGGTAYSIYDILSSLIRHYSGGKMKRSGRNKYTYLNEAGNAVFIKIPKLDPDTDESTFPKKFPTDEARRMRMRDYRSFMAMEQQLPLAPETTPFYWDNLRTYDAIPEEGRSPFCWASIDPVRVGGDNLAMPIFTKVGNDFFLVDCLYEATEMDRLYGQICDKIEQHNITTLVIEKNTDTSLKKVLTDMLHARAIYYCNIIEIYTYEKKDIRITNMQSTIKTQLVFPAERLYGRASAMGRFMYDIVSFSWKMSDNLHDDSIDAVTMFCETLICGKNQRVKLISTFKR